MNNYPNSFKNLTNAKHQLEWLLELCMSLIDGRFTGAIEIQFKDGGISSITKPKEKVLTYNQIKRAGCQ